jgi:hypothetical protein
MNDKDMCGGCCGCSSELTTERLEKKENWLKDKLEWVRNKKEELAKSDKEKESPWEVPCKAGDSRAFYKNHLSMYV